MTKLSSHQEKKQKDIMSESSSKTIRIVPFSGKEEDYWKWSWTFMAAAKVRKYKDVLSGKTKVPSEVL